VELQQRNKSGMRWKLFVVLMVLAAAGALALLPSAPSMFAGVQQSAGMPLPLFLVATFLQSFLLSAVLAFLGLVLGRRTGLGAPLLESLVYGRRGGGQTPGEETAAQPTTGAAGLLGLSVIVGLAAGALTFGIDVLFVRAIRIELTAGTALPNWWQALLSSFYGGINEEIMMRLFFLNALVWVLGLVFRRNPAAAPWTVWTAVIAASVLFGVSHLPAVQAMIRISPIIVVRTLVLNLIPGIAFGVLFWRRGLVSAMTAHFSADILMHVVAPLLFPALAGV